MKTSIAGILVANAIDYVEKARTAQDAHLVPEEVHSAIGAHLMIAIAIEGIGNEIGEIAFESWQWKRLERSDTPLKWYFISGVGKRTPFDPSQEPLQTVRHLASIRNRLAHPKIEDLG